MVDGRVRQAMVLAAGLGTRLRPLTDHLPKPMVPVLNRPLLTHIVERLAASGVERILLNTHHLPRPIQDWAAAHPAPSELELLHEPEILGTGGALANARERLFGHDAFLLHNGDVWSDADLEALVREHAAGDAMVTLLLTDWPPVNSVLLGADGTVRDLGDGHGVEPGSDDRRLTYTGIAVISRDFLASLPPGFSSLAAAFLQAIASRPGAIRGFVPPRLVWSDLGTPRRFLQLHAELLTRNERIVRGAEVHLADDVQLDGFCVLGDGCRLDEGVALSDCVVLAGTRVTGPVDLHRVVLGNGWKMSADRAPNQVPAHVRGMLNTTIPDTQLTPLTGQGSDRRFWRFQGRGATWVLMDSSEDPSEFERCIRISEFLHVSGLGGAHVRDVSADDATAIFEDLGDVTLQSLLAREPGIWREHYGSVLELLARLQTSGTERALAGACPQAVDRRFGRRDLLAETEYFRRRFLGDVCGLGDRLPAALAEEFKALAAAVAAQPPVLMHRDFQSTNILFTDGEVRLIDVQGMRLGPRGYDPASLIRDPYVDLATSRAETLLADWCTALTARGVEADPDTVVHETVLAGLQRSMQALGAYGYLSRIKGLRGFRDWIAPGLGQLARGLEAAADLADAPDMPILSSLVSDLIGRDLKDRRKGTT